MRIKNFLTLLLLSTLANTAAAQVKVGDNGEISGLVFGDYYWIASDHNSNIEGNNGFWIRRIYFTYDQKLSKSFSARLRLEMNSQGDFSSSLALRPYVKDAYLKWKYGRQRILAGIAPTPAYSFVESVWGYRSVEKAPLDLQKMASSRDFGLSFKGGLGTEEKWHYFFMFANGSGEKTELNKGKKFMLSLAYDLTDQITIQAYGDWNDRPGGQNIYTMQGFLAWQTENMHVGLLYAHQVQQKVLSGQNLVLDMASVFSRFKITDEITGLLRADHLFEANPAGESIDYIPFSSQAESTLLIGGADIELIPDVHLIPNIETVIYGQTPPGKTPATDVIPRLTLFYVF